jgi:HEAT repeat protein
MEKLVERESAARNPLVAAPALAVQFFLIPLVVVGVTVLVYMGFRSMLVDDRSPQDYLAEIRTGGANRQWPAAYELSRLMSDPGVRADRALAPALVRAFEEARDGDPRVRRYLALAIGRLDPPLPPEAVTALVASLDEPGTQWSPDWFSRFNGWTEIDISEARITTIWALGSSGDPTVVPRLQLLLGSADAGIRKMAVYSLGALPGDAQLAALRTALGDEAPDVRWNAAIALARHGDHEGVRVLRQMLDRPYVEQTVKREVRLDADVDPVADVIIGGLRALAALKDASLRAPIEELSRQDPSMKVRQAALEALKVIG